MKYGMKKWMLGAAAVLGLGLAQMPAEAGAGKNLVETAVEAGQFNTLVAAVKAAGLVDALSGKDALTVFAPTDDAFAKLPAGTVDALLQDTAKLKSILLYHVVAGSVKAADAVKLNSADTLFGQPLAIDASDGVRVGGASVVAADVMASNGVIHVIDTVLIPKNIVEVAQAAGSFNTLVAAVQAAGLVETLSGDGPFTVFAPTDEAFAKLPKETLASLLKPENKGKLAAILTYHVAPGALKAADVVGKKSIKTVHGNKLAVQVKGDAVAVDGAGVAATDIIALNGVIHVIDSVVLPSE